MLVVKADVLFSFRGFLFSIGNFTSHKNFSGNLSTLAPDWNHALSISHEVFNYTLTTNYIFYGTENKEKFLTMLGPYSS